MVASGAIRIGISGWTYKPWRGVFYPAGLAQAKELAYAARQVEAIEINGTFYALQRPDTFAHWFEETPDGFIFAVKAPRYITHRRRLKEVGPFIANFFASGLLRLGDKLGPLLWQLPPHFQFDHDRLERFLDLLPHDTAAAAAVARRHQPRMQGRAWTTVEAARPLRHAIEVRHQSFASAGFIELLRAKNVALVVADSVAWPRLMDITSDFIYCRLHGSQELYASGYETDALKTWASRILAWARGEEPEDAERVIPQPGPRRRRDVFVFFDNDVKARAPADARQLMALVARRLGQQPGSIPGTSAEGTESSGA